MITVHRQQQLQLCLMEHKPTRRHDLELDPVTLNLDPDIDILKTHLLSENKVARGQAVRKLYIK